MRRIKQVFLVAVCTVTGAHLIEPAFAQDNNAVDARAQSAIKITRDCNEFTAKVDQLIAQNDAVTAQTNRLNGTAKRFQSKVAPTIKPLKGAQLAQAKKMYQSDLNQFASHVAAYQEHNANVRQHYGECAASKAAYERNKNSYMLHCKEFHIEDLPPPHVCVTMEEAMTNSTEAAGRLKSSVKKLVDSQIELMKTESRLSAAIANSANVDKDVRKQHELNLKEQELAVEFAQLQEEHKQLEMEKRTLSASGVKTIVPTVKARIRK
ncbi:MAG: hypothetical protein JST44_10185 [Cyanobacteria bacterium SZAS LIN-5]|nr:hypothetical protein [Cyanobacteria bacterium SZAS LIN-5]